ncbi:undecaprenyldiphospho-muramoylpentapeptide beta-N-acetylglucosaminyltransferase [Cellulophaga lytica]|uniref:UDP-N-acetylglucosamine--N-acetylmuramyl-(pentapeptide) pyrophosphoryl-undecaprenol N-acetylglucosamine transferase n=1 Tax=Cellulophaga lytica (strain ATCC 23178 / DSM 7489 / JCM 8516 / NBRC 14961 / NCIMB 1423 / VKM B-1433 / Cy l20) TaxID=867900 RepID=F0RDT3_CELLC|nr:undecaprenyldiphospho-muramoylpentapeptide beta-N-acetylglucosaminyltransferase [Cellulophaga lytica]ADY29844.1 UDP-N-acetylglucosamine--N-acetylmuramyl- (pentapeptide) pyrophosphoryl-undecaprenol N-acetylglucosamine transferase [Cellulophaga lytica DSM 7489]WQG75990.1 undecaprenyldiphospho-muramoylpentapeptide beta-N-acetylglucosaminyltransferase [Cellulophaga lytica]
MNNYKFILSGGGTGGHIYPAIAIANELKEMYPDAEFLFVGAKDRMEMEKVPQAGYKIEGLWISGLQRKLTFKNMLFPLKVISSLYRSKQIIKKFKPNAVIGTGGFASGPLLRMAAGKNIPCVLQEQNSYAGITNKLLAGKVQKICVAYDGMDRFFEANKIVKTGNPVRKDLVEMKATKQQALEFFGLKSNKSVLLVLGGSLGAKRVNTLIKEQLPLFASLGVQVIWQCGKLYYQDYKNCQNENVLVFDFLNKMDFAYAAADLIISRSGAGSVSELSIVGKPVIFIPSPNVAEDHQTKNALAYADKNAAILIKEKELDVKFKTVFTDLFQNKERQVELGENIKKQALPNATKNIALEVQKLLNK